MANVRAKLELILIPRLNMPSYMVVRRVVPGGSFVELWIIANRTRRLRRGSA